MRVYVRVLPRQHSRQPPEEPAHRLEPGQVLESLLQRWRANRIVETGDRHPAPNIMQACQRGTQSTQRIMNQFTEVAGMEIMLLSADFQFKAYRASR